MLVRPGDTLVLYGREPRIAELDRRHRDAAGDVAYERATAEQLLTGQHDVAGARDDGGRR
jgi:hypothetical protein